MQLRGGGLSQLALNCRRLGSGRNDILYCFGYPSFCLPHSTFPPCMCLAPGKSTIHLWDGLCFCVIVSVLISSEHSLIPLIFLQILHWCPYCAARSIRLELAIECARSHFPCGVTGNQLSLILRKGTRCRQNPSG